MHKTINVLTAATAFALIANCGTACGADQTPKAKPTPKAPSGPVLIVLGPIHDDRAEYLNEVLYCGLLGCTTGRAPIGVPIGAGTISNLRVNTNFDPPNNWDAEHYYHTDDIVTYQSPTDIVPVVYIALSHNMGVAPETNPGTWAVYTGSYPVTNTPGLCQTDVSVEVCDYHNAEGEIYCNQVGINCTLGNTCQSAPAQKYKTQNGDSLFIAITPLSSNADWCSMAASVQFVPDAP
jgi:hypothetical protein